MHVSNSPVKRLLDPSFCAFALYAGDCQQVLLHACRTLRFLSTRCFPSGYDDEDEVDCGERTVYNSKEVVRQVTLAVIDAGICHGLVELLDHKCPPVQTQAFRTLYNAIEANSCTLKVRRQAIPTTAAFGGGVAFRRWVLGVLPRG